MTLPNTFASFDLIESGILDSIAIELIVAQALAIGKPSVLRGGTSTSLESSATEIHYRLLTGDMIATSVATLDRIYRTHLLDLACRVSGRSMIVSNDIVNGVNINILEGTGSRYEWHVDSNPLTGVLYLTTTSAARGGRLIFKGESEDLYLPARPGQLFLFDARNAPHAVEPIVDGARVCAPLNFFVAGEAINRPADLDENLYGAWPT